MDQELFDALKKVSINDEIANADFSNKAKKTKNTKKNKKNGTKKGQDFLDFAQEKGIDVKFQYEEKEEAKKFYNKENNQNFKGKFNNQKNSEFENKTYQEKTYQNNNYQNNKFQNNKFQNDNYQKKPFNFQNKTKNNKFDQVNNMMYNPLAFNQMRSPMMNNNPYQMQNQMNPNNQMNQQFDLINQDPFFAEERSLEESLVYLFSPDFLNREIYLRKRISPEGLIDLTHVLNHNR